RVEGSGAGVTAPSSLRKQKARHCRAFCIWSALHPAAKIAQAERHLSRYRDAVCVDARLDHALDGLAALMDRIADGSGIVGELAEPSLDERPFERDLQRFAVDGRCDFDR